MPRLYYRLNAEPRGFFLAGSEHCLHRCWTQTPIATIPAMEPRRRREVRVANAFGNFHHLLIDFFFLDAGGLGRRVVFKVVERGAFYTMAFEFRCQRIKPELNAVHSIERVARCTRFVIEHEHAAPFQTIDPINTTVDHYVFDRKANRLLGAEDLRLGFECAKGNKLTQLLFTLPFIQLPLELFVDLGLLELSPEDFDAFVGAAIDAA